MEEGLPPPPTRRYGCDGTEPLPDTWQRGEREGSKYPDLVLLLLFIRCCWKTKGPEPW